MLNVDDSTSFALDPNDGTISPRRGNPKRGTGILNNELYVGKLVWDEIGRASCRERVYGLV